MRWAWTSLIFRFSGFQTMQCCDLGVASKRFLCSKTVFAKRVKFLSLAKVNISTTIGVSAKATPSTSCAPASSNFKGASLRELTLVSGGEQETEMGDVFPETSSAVANAKRALEALESAVSYHKEGTSSSLINIVALIDGLSESHIIVPPRIVYLAIDLALRSNNLDVADKLCGMMPQKVHVLATSLRIRLFAAKARFQDALKEMEEVLNDDNPAFEVKYKVSNLALNELYSAISTRTDTHGEMKRFRYLQKVLTKYNRRTNADFKELLYSPVYSILSLISEPVRTSLEVDPKITEKILKLSPHVLCED